MTEAEWRAGYDLAGRLALLCRRGSERKVRLFLCGGCRAIAHRFYHPASLEAVNVAERFADGLATEVELGRANYAAECPTFGSDYVGTDSPDDPHRRAVSRFVKMGVLPASCSLGGAWQVSESDQEWLHAAAELAYTSTLTDIAEGAPFRAHLLPLVGWPGRWLFDCVAGPLFRKSASRRERQPLTASWLGQAAYENRSLPSGHLDPARLAVLSDALEEAGCADAELLSHLRSPGPHVRGCWALDLILGKS